MTIIKDIQYTFALKQGPHTKVNFKKICKEIKCSSREAAKKSYFFSGPDP